MAEKNNDVTDNAAAAEGGAENGKAKTRQPKPTPAPNPQTPEAAGKGRKGRKGKKGKNKLSKPRRRLILLIIVIGAVALLAAAVVLEVFFLNWFGTRDLLISGVTSLDPDFAREKRNLEARTMALDEFESELDRREIEMELRELEVTQLESRLETRRVELDIIERGLIDWENRLLPIYRRNITPELQEEMESISRMYTQMSPEKAAEILFELDDIQDVVAILYYMTERNASAILAVIEPEQAARITELLIYN